MCVILPVLSSGDVSFAEFHVHLCFMTMHMQVRHHIQWNSCLVLFHKKHHKAMLCQYIAWKTQSSMEFVN